LISQGYSFGAYQQNHLIAFALGEAFSNERFVRVWEFHAQEAFRRSGVGRKIMERVLAKAHEDRMDMIMLETQNTNVPAIRFYRSMGYTIHAIDLSHYFLFRRGSNQPGGIHHETQPGIFIRRVNEKTYRILLDHQRCHRAQHILSRPAGG
jgi:hypothetical protein